ncbi:MAG: SCO1664 family protein [Anaerolineae bacterium]|nr:MAG: SCO1664 family protein [Anaerolineae bacterium]
MLAKKKILSLVDLLENGQIELDGLVPWGSNYTFLVQVVNGTSEVNAIYKPSQGERPLWDFASGTLSLRERAAFLVSEMFGWHFVPPTVLREGPHGFGSVQFFVDHDPKKHYLTFREEIRDQAQAFALFDILINNADRKSGHVIQDDKGQFWLIDHGVCFHTEYKLRSVIWDFSGAPIPKLLLDDLHIFQSTICSTDNQQWIELNELLSAREIAAFHARLERLIQTGNFPPPGPGRHYPWPLV